MRLDGSQMNFFIAFVAGFITFFASCFLPLVPTYLAILSGSSNYKDENRRRDVLKNAGMFVVGFVAIFILLGLTVNSIGTLLIREKKTFETIGGLLFVFVGIAMSGLIRSSWILKELRLTISPNITKWRLINSLLMGLTFGFAWTPCIGPVLAVILFMASQEKTALTGMLLMSFYGLGLGFPFILVALGYEKILKRLTKWEAIIRIIASILLIMTGFLLLTGNFGFVTLKLADTFHLENLTK